MTAIGRIRPGCSGALSAAAPLTHLLCVCVSVRECVCGMGTERVGGSYCRRGMGLTQPDCTRHGIRGFLLYGIFCFCDVRARSRCALNPGTLISIMTTTGANTTCRSNEGSICEREINLTHCSLQNCFNSFAQSDPMSHLNPGCN